MRTLGLPAAAALALATALLARPAPAAADELIATRAQPLTEVSHSVEVTIDRGVARYRVRRAFANTGQRSDEARVHISLPHGAAATGLRIRARDRWYEGELMEAEEARAKYQELTGVGAWEPKDPALLQWTWADELMLQVFPVFAGSVNTVEYTLTAPLEYREGTYVLSYPRANVDDGDGTTPMAEPVVRVVPGYGRGSVPITIAGLRVADDTPAVLRVPPPPPWVGEGGPHPDYGYAISPLDVEDEGTVTEAEVTVDIDHTFSGDLHLSLVTPAGIHLEVGEGEGGDNDIRTSFEVDLPGPTEARGRWHLVVSDQAGADVGSIDAWSLALSEGEESTKVVSADASGLPIFIPDANEAEGTGGHALIEIAPPAIDTVAARLGRVVASSRSGFARLELDMAPELRPLPEKASVVFVLDASISAGDSGLEEQLRIMRAYLSHVPDASVEVVAVDRAARRGFGRFVRLDELDDAIERAARRGRLALGNGSALEVGLSLAADVLHGQRGPKRIVALTDELLRTRFENAMAQRSLSRAPDSTIAHVAALRGGDAELTRADGHPLASIPASQHGVFFVLEQTGREDKELAPALLGMVRPVAIDHFAVSGIDLSSARAVPKTMPEGEGYRAMTHDAAPPSRVVLTGKIWAEDFRRVVRNTPHFDEATAAFVFSEDEYGELTEDEMRTVAFKGRAVSPVTSYLATEPGVRPSWDGLEGYGVGEAFGVGGMGTGAPRIRVAAARRPPDMPAELGPGIRACAAKHGLAKGWSVELDVETTWREIVDVQLASKHDADAGTCITEAVWETELGRGATWAKREQHRVVVRAE